MQFVIDAAEAQFQATLDAPDSSHENIEQALFGFVNRLLSLLYLVPVQAVPRLVAFEVRRSKPVKKCYVLGPVHNVAAVADYLTRLSN
jgi:hypothetical protein